MNIQDYKKQREEERKKKFKCFNTNCDNNGSIATQDSDGNWEQEQCQFCTEHLLPIDGFNNESIDGAFALIEKEIERLIANTKEHNEADCKYIFAGCSECGKTKTLRDLLSSLKENK